MKNRGNFIKTLKNRINNDFLYQYRIYFGGYKMRKLSQEQLKKMNEWMQKFARPYDIAKWNYLFNGGTKESIIEELLKYQNADGGFGNGFEADILYPLSAAIPSAEAIFQAYEYDLDCNSKWFHNLLSYFENSVQDISKYWEDIPPKRQ